MTLVTIFHCHMLHSTGADGRLDLDCDLLSGRLPQWPSKSNAPFSSRRSSYFGSNETVGLSSISRSGLSQVQSTPPQRRHSNGLCE